MTADDGSLSEQSQHILFSGSSSSDSNRGSNIEYAGDDDDNRSLLLVLLLLSFDGLVICTLGNVVTLDESGVEDENDLIMVFATVCVHFQ